VLVQRLLSFALDGNVADPVALQTIRDALDRVGLNAKTEVDISLKPCETILESMQSGSRAEWRAAQGIEDDSDTQRELPAADDDLVIDVVEATEEDLIETLRDAGVPR
jgi:hypothetical protein